MLFTLRGKIQNQHYLTSVVCPHTTTVQVKSGIQILYPRASSLRTLTISLTIGRLAVLRTITKHSCRQRGAGKWLDTHLLNGSNGKVWCWFESTSMLQVSMLMLISHRLSQEVVVSIYRLSSIISSLRTRSQRRAQTDTTFVSSW